MDLSTVAGSGVPGRVDENLRRSGEVHRHGGPAVPPPIAPLRRLVGAALVGAGQRVGGLTSACPVAEVASVLSSRAIHLVPSIAPHDRLHGAVRHRRGRAPPEPRRRGAMAEAEMPRQSVGQLRHGPRWARLARVQPWLAYESAATGNGRRGGASPARLARGVAQNGPELAPAPPDGWHRVLDGRDHVPARWQSCPCWRRSPPTGPPERKPERARSRRVGR